MSWLKNRFTQLTNKQWFRRLVFYGLPILLVIISLFPILFFKNFVGVTGDNPFPILKSDFLHWSNFRLIIWSDNNFGVPILYPTEISIDLILGFLVWIGFSTQIIAKLVMVFCLISSFFSIFYLLKYFSKPENTYSKVFLWLISFLYVFNPLVFTRIAMSHYWYLIAYSLTPLVFLCALNKNRKVFLISILLFWISLIQIQFLVFNFLIILLALWVFLDIKKIEKWFRTLILLVFAILTNLFWILPFKSQQSTDIISTSITLRNFARNSLSLTESLKGTGYISDFYSDIISNHSILQYWNILAYLPFVLFLVGIYKLFRDKKYLWIGVFTSILAITLVFITSFKYFLKDIFYWLFSTFTPFALFRELYHLEFIVFIIFLIIASYSVKINLKKFGKYMHNIILSVLAVSVAFYALPFAYINSDRYTPEINTNLEQDYKNFESLDLNQINGNYRMLYLPLASIVRYEDNQFIWGRNRMLFDSGVPSIDVSSESNLIYNTLYENLYDSLTQIEKPNNQDYFKIITNKYSFRYFVVDEAVIPIDKLDMGKVKKYFDGTYKKIFESGKLSVYENPDYFPIMSVRDSLADVNTDPLNLDYSNFNNLKDNPIYFNSYDKSNYDKTDVAKFGTKVIVLNDLIKQADKFDFDIKNNSVKLPALINGAGNYDVFSTDKISRLSIICNDNTIYGVPNQINVVKSNDNELKLDNIIVNDRFEIAQIQDPTNVVLDINGEYLNLKDCNKTEIEYNKYISKGEKLAINIYRLKNEVNIFNPLDDGNIETWTQTALCKVDTIPKSNEILNSKRVESSLNILLNAERSICLNKTLNLSNQNKLLSVSSVMSGYGLEAQLKFDDNNGMIGGIKIQPTIEPKEYTLYSPTDKDKVYLNLFVSNIVKKTLGEIKIDSIKLREYDLIDTKNIGYTFGKIKSSEIDLEKKTYDIYLDISKENSINNGNFAIPEVWNIVGDCNKYDNKTIEQAGVYAKVVNENNQNLLELGAKDHASCIYQSIIHKGSPYYYFTFDYKTIEGYSPKVSLINSQRKSIKSINDLITDGQWHTYSGLFQVEWNEKNFFLEVSQNAYQGELLKEGLSQFKNFELRNITQNLEEPYLIQQKSEKQNNITPIKSILHWDSRTKYVLDVITDRDFYYTNGQVFHPGWTVGSVKPEYGSITQFDEACKSKGLVTKEICNIDDSIEIKDKPRLLAENNHIKVNNFHNSWYVELSEIPNDQKIDLGNGLKSVRIVVEYQPQKLFNFGLIIYVATLSVLILWVIIPDNSPFAT